MKPHWLKAFWSSRHAEFTTNQDPELLSTPIVSVLSNMKKNATHARTTQRMPPAPLGAGIWRLTFNPQRYDHTLVLDAVDQLAAIRAAILQLKATELQGGVHVVRLGEGGPPAKAAVGLEGVRVGYHDDVLPTHALRLQLGPFHFVLAGLGSQDTRHGGVFAPPGDDVGVQQRLQEVLQLLGSCL